jgi:hypothetical protein
VSPGRKRSSRVDLSERSDFFLELISSPLLWKERLVNELQFGDGNHVRAVSSFQIDFPPALLEPFVNLKKARWANVLIPITTREKQLLLNLGVSGPANAPATVTTRASTAALQAQYLRALAETSPSSKALGPEIDDRLWEAICAYSPGFFDATFLAAEPKNFAAAVARFLSSGLTLTVSESEVRRWQSKTKAAGQVLSAALGEPGSRLSSSEEVLLALTSMSPLPTSTAEIDAIVERFYRAVVLAERGQDTELLTALAKYGRRYELIVEVEVPLLEPSRIKVEEDLPLLLKQEKMRFNAEHRFVVGDARSSHLEGRVSDPHVEIKGMVSVRDAVGRDASGWLEAIRETPEALAIYSSEPDRPAFVTLAIGLGVARHMLVAAGLLICVNLLAIALAFFVGNEPEAASRLAVIAVPTTIAATFVLTREQTALASRLQAVPRLALTMSTLALWLVVSLQLWVLDSPYRPGQSGHPACSAKSTHC